VDDLAAPSCAGEPVDNLRVLAESLHLLRDTHTQPVEIVMSETVKKAENKNDAANSIAGVTPIEAPGDFTPLSTNALIYKPDDCHTHAVQGMLLGRLQMPPVGGEREWDVYVLRATKPTIGVDREGKVHAVKAGDEIRVPVTHVLDSDAKMQAISGSTEWTAEVYLKPTQKISIGGGKTLWQYDARMGKPRVRTPEEKMYNLTKIQGMATAAGQLPASANGQQASPPPPF
jgi:hypothetical protein